LYHFLRRFEINRTRNTSFYSDKKWERKRLRVLKNDKYECQNCKRFYKTTTAQVVHHIFFYEDYSELGLTNWNLVSLCNSCHNKMHNRHNDTATRLGLEWQDKKKKDFEIYFKNKNEKVRD